MAITFHGQNLARISLMGWVNCYLVREQDGLTLIDTGTAGSERPLLDAAKALDTDIVRITITHAHADHVGSLDALRGALPFAEIAIHHREAQDLGGNTRPTRELVHDDRVGSLRVIHTPGHSPGHVAFLDERDGTLIVGDTITTMGRLALAGKVTLPFPFPALASWNRALALQSALALRNLLPHRLATGHGPVLEAPSEALDKALRAAGVL